MAKNWTIKEALNEIKERKFQEEGIADIYRRFPRVAMLLTRITAGDCNAAETLINYFPDWATVGKIEKAIKTSIVSTDLEEAEEAEEIEEEAEENESDDEEDENETPDYESMKPQELFKMCKEKGIRVISKKDSKYYARKLKEFEEAQKKAENDADDDWDDEEPEEKVEKKTANKPKQETKEKTKPKKKIEVEDDDEEDWDI